MADGLAKAGCTLPTADKPLFFEEPPDFVRTFLQKDKTGVPRIRKKQCVVQQLADVNQAFCHNDSANMSMAASNSPFVIDAHHRAANISTAVSWISNNYDMDASASTSL